MCETFVLDGSVASIAHFNSLLAAGCQVVDRFEHVGPFTVVMVRHP